MKKSLIIFLLFSFFCIAEKTAKPVQGLSKKQILSKEETEAGYFNDGIRANHFCCDRAHKTGSFIESNWKDVVKSYSLPAADFSRPSKTSSPAPAPSGQK